MNHLCGLDSTTITSTSSSDDDDAVFWSSLSNYEVEELQKFRIAYNKLRPTTTTSSAKNTITTTRSTNTIPQFLISTDDLFECGWRPLDDITLYRFLCADVITESSRGGNKKKFQLSKSLDRLQRAMQFRKDKRVDDLLRDIVISTTMKECGGGGGGGGGNNPRRKNSCKYMSPPSSFSRMASGSLSPCGSHIENIQINNVVEEIIATSTPKTNKKLLLHRNTTETARSSSLSESSSSSSVSGDDGGSNTPDILVVGTTNITSAFPATPNNTILKDLDKYQRLRVRVFTGRDYQQQPVMFERLGEFLGSGNCTHFSDEEWCQFYIWDLERHFVEMRNSALAEEKKRGRGENTNKNLPIITKYTFCGDCSGIVSAILNGSIWNVVPLLKVLVRSVEDFYPEIAARIVLFNFPKVATVIYRAVKSFLDPVTASKISLHAGIPSAKVFDIPLDAIPKEYGGTSPVEYPKTASS